MCKFVNEISVAELLQCKMTAVGAPSVYLQSCFARRRQGGGALSEWPAPFNITPRLLRSRPVSSTPLSSASSGLPTVPIPPTASLQI